MRANLKTLYATAAALLALLALPLPALGQLRVVATVPDLAAITKAVGGDLVSVQSMALPTQDPHFVDAKPSLVLQLNGADLVVLLGLGLEQGWLPTLLTGARNGDIQPGGDGYLDCSTLVHKLGVPAQPVDRSMGDVHSGGNPHYLYDPRAASAVAGGIAKRLGRLAPRHADAFERNRARFDEQLTALRTRLETRMKPHRGAPFVAYHATTLYLASWLGLTEVAFVEPKPGIAPNPGHVAQLLSLARARGVKVLVQEVYYPDVTSKVVAQRIPARLLRVAGGTDFAKGQSYLERLEALVSALAAALEAGPSA